MAGQPAETLAFLLHSLYGMDHYPSYLLKWPPDQLQRLRDALTQQIAQVDAAAAAVTLRQQQLLSYAPLAPRLTKDQVLSWVNPLILNALQAPRDRVLPLLLRAAVDELDDGSVWSFDLLTRDGAIRRPTPLLFSTCDALPVPGVDRLIAEAENYGMWESAQEEPWGNQGFNRRHVPLTPAGLDVVQDVLLSVCVPLAAALFPSVAGGDGAGAGLTFRSRRCFPL
jgi:hypothetical protein